MRAVMEEALKAASNGTAGFHVSLDMDWIEPRGCAGRGHAGARGATYREAHLAMRSLPITAAFARLRLSR